MIPTTLLYVAHHGGLRWQDHRVLVELNARLDLHEFRELKGIELATLLDIHDADVSRSLRLLVEAGYVEREECLDPVFAYGLRVSPPRKAPGQLLAGVFRHPDERPRVVSKHTPRGASRRIR